MNSVSEQIKSFWHTGDGLNRLLFINTAVFLAVVVFRLGYWAITGQAGAADALVVDWLGFPSNPTKLLFRFWTPITYMFLHVGFWHFFFNMLILFFIGQIFREYLGAQKLVGVYLLGGLVGGFFYFFAYNLLPVFNGISGVNMGASAGVLAVMVAATVKVPKLPVKLYFVLTVPLWGVTVLLLVLDLVNLPLNNPGGHLAHLGGAALGYFFVQQLNKGRDWSQEVNQILQKITGFLTTKPKLQKVYSKTQQTQRTAAKHQTTTDQKRIDVILDKISSSGYDSLTKEEKEFLFKYGKQ